MKRILTVSLAALLVLLLAACGDKEETDGKSSGEEIDIEHDLGTTTVSKNPEKVIVFDFGALDTLDALGVEIEGVARGGAVPSYLSTYDSDEYENIGSLKEPDFDKIAEIDPDLIIISGRQSEMYDELSKLGPTIFIGIDTTRYMDSFKENVKILGEIFELEDEVAAKVEDIERSIDGLNEKAEELDQNALIILANDDKISAYGSNSRFGILHDVFGIDTADENIEASTHGMNVSFEYVLEMDPDLLYVIDRTAAIGEESSAQEIVENKLVQKTKAYENDNIFYLDPDNWYLSGGGLISVENMVREIEESLE